MLDQSKNLIRKILYWIHFNFSVIRMKLVKVEKDKRVYLVDLDNTLADTWPTLNLKFSHERDRLLAIKPFKAMRYYVNNLFNEGNYVVIISYRSIINYNVSRTWLRQNKISYNLLVIVDDPTKKVELLEKIYKNYQIVFIDDLSYNHENGTIEVYYRILERIKDLGINYIGKDRIDRFNTLQSEIL
jgi:hypothetical protein